MALDAVDEAVYKGFCAYRKLRQEAYFDTWMTRILINACNAELRRRKRELAGQLAEQSGKRVSAQAVGGAVGHNRVSIIIPCHRVVGSGGSLTGYAGGLENKIKLLELESADLGGLYRPTKGTAL